MTDVRTKSGTEKYTRYGKRNKKKEKNKEEEEEEEEGDNKKKAGKISKKKRTRASEEIQTHTGRLRRVTTISLQQLLSGELKGLSPHHTSTLQQAPCSPYLEHVAGSIHALDQAFVFRVPVHRSCLLYTSPSPRDQRGSRMPSSA